ncbi:MAG: hypothetical protein J6D20_02635 [Clostridia bacterium]|nr:hypothetical protein [Clostridia bacterium]
MEKAGSLENAARDFEQSISLHNTRKKAMAKSMLNSAGILVGVLLLFVVVVIITTDIRLAPLAVLKELGVEFTLLMCCSYFMYLTCSDSGMRHGLNTEAYRDACDKFNKNKSAILEKENQTRMYAFCRHFINNELKNTKMNILAVVGYNYNTYIRNFLGVDKTKINESRELSKAQKKAINEANAIKPITLTPEMILKRGRYAGRRNPLGITPEMKKRIHVGLKFITTLLFTLLVTLIVFDIVIEPTWLMVAGGMLKLLIVIYNGFTGYKMGYENIVFDTVNYMSDQTDLMAQAIRYFESSEEEEEDK